MTLPSQLEPAATPGARRALLESHLAAAGSEACRHAFVGTAFETARAAADAADRAYAAGRALAPLAGLAVSIKDLFDIEGDVTRAGSTVLADRAPAASDATAVARLRAAGAALVGRTQMTEFAFSGVGINPHHGTPRNPATARLDDVPRVPGGSSSGAAVSVAAGAAWAALGTDTGGSIRIPAALQGLVGFKSTARLVPADGTVPLAPSLDTVCAITRDVADAIRVHEVLAARRVVLARRPVRALRLAVPREVMLDRLDAVVARAFERSLAALRAAGATVTEIALPALAGAPANLTPIEAWAWHRRLLEARPSAYDPRVAQRLHLGAAVSAADYLDLLQARRDWIGRVAEVSANHDAFLSPTVPVVAPPLHPLLDDDAEFFAANALLLRNPALVNLLDGCAISLPCQAPDELPCGLMLWSHALRDDDLLDAALAVEAVLRASAAA